MDRSTESIIMHHFLPYFLMHSRLSLFSRAFIVDYLYTILLNHQTRQNGNSWLVTSVTMCAFENSGGRLLRFDHMLFRSNSHATGWMLSICDIPTYQRMASCVQTSAFFISAVYDQSAAKSEKIRLPRRTMSNRTGFTCLPSLGMSNRGKKPSAMSEGLPICATESRPKVFQ